MTEEKENKVSRYRIPVLVAFFSLGSLFFIGMASAGPLTDIPAAMGVSLGISAGLAKMILSVAILTSAGLAMAIAGKGENMMATLVILLAVEGLLTAIGWLTVWLLLMTAVLIAAMYAGKIRDATSGSSPK
jgi:hypothetical protein